MDLKLDACDYSKADGCLYVPLVVVAMLAFGMLVNIFPC